MIAKGMVHVLFEKKLSINKLNSTLDTLTERDSARLKACSGKELKSINIVSKLQLHMNREQWLVKETILRIYFFVVLFLSESFLDNLTQKYLRNPFF